MGEFSPMGEFVDIVYKIYKSKMSTNVYIPNVYKSKMMTLTSGMQES